MPWGIETPDGTIRHEPSYYLLLFDFLLFAYLYRKLLRKETQSGTVLRDFVLIFAVGRLFLDTFRASDLAVVDPRILDLTVAQWFFLGQVIVGIGLILFLRKRSIRTAKVSP
jgi:prolipoprotein diacylglyceryltransferase